MINAEWTDLLLAAHPASPAVTWHGVAQALAQLALGASSPEELHRMTVLPDRILAESAFDLWKAFPTAAPRTSARLAQWCTGSKAVLIMDALSLREMKVIVEEAKRRELAVSAEVTFSEAPSDTTAFAKALGTPTRASLANNGKSGSFKLFGGRCSTDSTSVPFEDVPVPPVPSVVIWHSFVDDLIHAGNKTAAEVFKLTRQQLQDDGFWKLVDALRTGRQLVITSDHGYADAAKFSTEIKEPSGAVDFLKANFHGKRFAENVSPQARFLPPLFLVSNGFCMVTGQRKWPVQGGFPKICHGGLSLLEVASPWIELPAK
ncbi:MAG: hypothetical protein IJ146_00125 [Kiritimatiellae bacterium]|nr:hypothetical protein [Kiritimatiellia bacterium]